MILSMIANGTLVDWPGCISFRRPQFNAVLLSVCDYEICEKKYESQFFTTEHTDDTEKMQAECKYASFELVWCSTRIFGINRILRRLERSQSSVFHFFRTRIREI